jgi:hypothetical protein
LPQPKSRCNCPMFGITFSLNSFMIPWKFLYFRKLIEIFI